MSDFGLTEKGFKRKQYVEIIDDMELKAKELFGENINLSERSPLGLFLRIIAWFLGILWQLAEKVYYSAYVDTSEGTSLDLAVKKNSILRRPSEKARGIVTFIGDDNTVITSGTLVATANGLMYATIEEVVITGETVDVEIEAVQPGAQGNSPAGTLTEIVNPISGVNEVVNQEPITGGRDVETDAELRERFYQSPAKDGTSTTAAIKAELLAMPGVRAAEVIENDTMENKNGQPPKSVHAFVLGGQRGDIAQAILRKKAGGIQAYGIETEVVKDESNRDRVIGWSPATVVDIWVKIGVIKNNKYPIDGDGRIATLVVEYIGGEDVDGSYNGLSMGQDVVLSKIVSECYKVPGVEDITVEISSDGNIYNPTNIEVGIGEVAETSADKVVVS